MCLDGVWVPSEIRRDLYDGKYSYSGSVYRNRRTPSEKQDGSKDSLRGESEEDDLSNDATPAISDNDLVCSLNPICSLKYPKYKEIIDSLVARFLAGDCEESFAGLATTELTKVKDSGGKIYSKYPHDEIDEEKAIEGGSIILGCFALYICQRSYFFA